MPCISDAYFLRGSLLNLKRSSPDPTEKTSPSCSRCAPKPFSKFLDPLCYLLHVGIRFSALGTCKSFAVSQVRVHACGVGKLCLISALTCNALQLNGFLRRKFLFLKLFFQSATLPVYFFLSSFVNMHFLSYYFSALNIFQGFSLSFARTLGRAVDKLLNGSRVNSHGQFIFGSQSLSLFRGNTTFQQSRRCYFSHFLDIIKTGLLFTFFRNCELLTIGRYTRGSLSLKHAPETRSRVSTPTSTHEGPNEGAE